MDPMTMSLIAGGAMKLWNTYSQGKAQQKAERKQREAYDNQIAEQNRLKEDATNEQRGTGSSLFTNFVTTRDSQKANALSNMYLQKYSDYRNSIRQYDSNISQLNAEKSKISNTSNSSIYGNMLGDAIETGVAAYGQYQQGLQMDKFNEVAESYKGANNAMQKYYTSMTNPSSDIKDWSMGMKNGPSAPSEYKPPKLGFSTSSTNDIFGPTQFRDDDIWKPKQNKWRF